VERVCWSTVPITFTATGKGEPLTFPLAGLDPGAAFGLLEEFHRLLDSGIKLVLATHHVHEILPQVERVIYLKAGRVEADGSPERLLTGPRLSELYDVSVHVTREQGYWLALPAEKR
ncbi:MAG: hypothetical protein AAGB27_14580, partial [Pseudomonadota bacterium]